MFNPGKRNVPRFLTEAWMDCGRRLWLIAPKTCPICWVSHMFSIWKHRYSYGICFGSVCALQNSTPNISTPNILSFCFLSTPEELKKCIFYVGAHDYIILYTYIYILVHWTDAQEHLQSRCPSISSMAFAAKVLEDLELEEFGSEKIRGIVRKVDWWSHRMY